MEKKAISVPGSKLYGPYTPGVKSGGIIWLSGQIDVEAGDDTASQTAGALAKIDALLSAAGVTKMLFVLLRFCWMTLETSKQ